MLPAARVQSAIDILDLIIAAAQENGPPADRILATWAREHRFAGSGDRRAIRDLVYRAIRACGPIPETGRAAILRLVEDQKAALDLAPGKGSAPDQGTVPDQGSAPDQGSSSDQDTAPGQDSAQQIGSAHDAASDAFDNATKKPILADLFDGSKYGPPPIGDGERAAEAGQCGLWLGERLSASDIEGEERAALLQRAPLDIRVNSLKAQREMVELPLPEGAEAENLPVPGGLRLPADFRLEGFAALREGQIEVQDHGSQWAALAVAAQPGETVIDLCAGAGGKTLALAAAMENRGRLIASDTNRARLSQLGPRAERAGANMIETILLNPKKELDGLREFHGMADAVLVDAPCSGTGTWRRSPETRWRMSALDLNKLMELQANLLRIAAKLVRKGGRLIYVTCSLLDEEGADQFAEFLAKNPEWQVKIPDIPIGRMRGQPVQTSDGEHRRAQNQGELAQGEQIQGEQIQDELAQDEQIQRAQIQGAQALPIGDGIRLTPYHDDTDGFFIAQALLK